MGLFDFLKSKKTTETPVSRESTGIVPKNTELTKNVQSLPIHPDLVGLLWIGDGPKKNYIQKTNSRTSTVDGLKITVTLSATEEPSLLTVSMPISFEGEAERPPYYPTYKGLSPQQKGEYWRLLANPYDNSINIGYVFILYYGLERFLLTDKYEQAIDVILKLRDIHSNGSFQAYSANAVVLTSIICQRPDVVAKFLASIDKDYAFAIDDNLYLLCKYAFGLPLTAKDIIRMAKSFEFTNMNYIKKYPEVFEQILIENIEKRCGVDGIIPNKFISKSEFRNLPYSQMGIFANVSIDCNSIVVPHILTSFKFKKAVYDLLSQTHEDVKSYLAQMRKQGTPVAEKEKPAAKEKVKEVPTFDTAREAELLADYNKQKNDPVNQHFTSIQLQALYYKYRDLDPQYLERCIHYCEDDISKLNILQDAYRKQEEDRIKKLRPIYSKAEIEEQLSQVTHFEGGIPAFQRLAIIHEKAKNYQEAITICDFAISYYSSVGVAELSQNFAQRKQKLEEKMAKG